jgi:Protein of unknown function (DUF3326)
VKIENKVYRLHGERQANWLDTLSAPLARQVGQDRYPLRFAIVDICESQIIVEATIVRFAANDRLAEELSNIELLTPRRKAFQGSPFGVVQIVPTGIRCELGGFAGDACPATNLLVSTADFLVTHPNAVNASELNEMASNIFYVEGKALDDFLLGHLGLRPVRSNTIGTFVDPTGLDYIDHVINTLNAAKAVKGIACDIYTVLRQEPGIKIAWSEMGCAVGTVLNPEAILEAVQYLLSRGAQAIGGVSVIHGVTKEMFSKHLRGEIPNPSGGIEAIITHLISKLFRIPTAHAPLPYYQGIKEKHPVNPRASAEFISSPHYFCVLKGLAKAPRLVPISDLNSVPADLISLNNIGAIITPGDCLGGIPALVAEFSDIPLIAVKDNTTLLNVTNQKLQMHNVIEVSSYLEAAGVVVALREGISLDSLRRPLHGAKRVELRMPITLQEAAIAEQTS